MVPAIVTGSPESIWNAIIAARSAKPRAEGVTRSRSAAHKIHGIHATDHERFGKLAGRYHRSAGGEHDGAECRARSGDVTPEKEPHAERRKRKRRRDQQVEAGNGRQHPQQHHRRQEQLIERVGKHRLARGRIGIPQRPGSGHERPVDPEVPRPEEHTEVADVEDVRQAEAAGERDARGENGERRPEPLGGSRRRR